MKTILLTILMLVGLSAYGGVNPIQPNRYTTNVDGALIDGGNLTNLQTIFNASPFNTNVLTITGAGQALVNGAYTWNPSVNAYTNGANGASVFFDVPDGNIWCISNANSAFNYILAGQYQFPITASTTDATGWFQAGGALPRPTTSFSVSSAYLAAVNTGSVNTNFIYIDPVKGSDTNWGFSPATAYKTMTNAARNSYSGQTLRPLPGVHVVTSGTQADLKEGVNLVGYGMDVTTITNTVANGISSFQCLGTNIVNDLTTYSYISASGGSDGLAPYRLKGVKFLANQDSVYPSVGNIDIGDCELYSSFDVLNGTSGFLNIHNSKMVIDAKYDSTSTNFPARGLNITGSAIVTLTGCTISSIDGSNTSCINIDGSGCKVFISGCQFTASTIRSPGWAHVINYDVAGGNVGANTNCVTFYGQQINNVGTNNVAGGEINVIGGIRKTGFATATGVTAVTVSAPFVTTNTIITLTESSPLGTPGAPYVSSLTAGTGFQFKSVASDTSIVRWTAMEAQ